MSAPTIPCFVMHWKRPDALTRTLAALRAQTVPVDLRVVDNGSPSHLVPVGLGDDVKLEVVTKNIGYGPIVNHALRKWLATEDAEFVAVSPHDALPRPDCLELLLESLRERPRGGIASAEFGEDTVPGYTLVHGYRSYPCIRTGRWCPAEFFNGTLYVLRRKCIQEIGLFDERYFAYAEECDLSRRAISAGWDVGQIWGAVVENPKTGRVTPSEHTWYLNLRNELLASRGRSGLPAAFVRSGVIGANALRALWQKPDIEHAPPAAIRWMALRDFWLGRFGPPPTSGFGAPDRSAASEPAQDPR